MPTRLVYVHVTFSRTITENGVDTTKDPSCPSTMRHTFESKETVSLSSPSYPMRDNGNRTNLEWKMSRLPTGAKPFTGSGEFTVHSEKHEQSCNSKGDDVGSGKIDLDVDKTRFSFEYERKPDTGTINLDTGWGEPSASGTITSKSGSNPPTKVDSTDLNKAQTQLMVTSMGNLAVNTAAMWAQMGPYAAQTEKAMEIMAMDAPVIVTEKDGTFTINYSVSRSFPLDKLDPPGSNLTRTGTRSITTSLQITIGGAPLEYDAIIEPMQSLLTYSLADYPTWIPVGPNPGPNDGKQDGVGFRVYLVNRAKPDVEVSNVPFQVTWELESSKEPGYAINYPVDGKDDPDLEWDAEMGHEGALASWTKTSATSKPDVGKNLFVVIRSRDFGAYGKLRAHVKVGKDDLLGHLKGDETQAVRIPYDQNDNKVADEWEKQIGMNEGGDWDKEHASGNDHDGDGLSFYEEYRGAVVSGTHIRLDNKDDKTKKDVFVIKKTDWNLESGAAYFERAAGGSVKIRILKPDEINLTTKVVNANSRTSHGGDQHAVLVKDVGSLPDDAVAACRPKNQKTTGSIDSRRAAFDHTATSPGDVIDLEIVKSSNPQDLDHEFAHELGHALGIHHHGDSTIKDISGYNGLMVDEDGDGVRLGPGTSGKVATAGSQASGDASCIMAYNHYFIASDTGHVLKDAPKLVAELKRIGTYKPSRDNEPVLLITKDVPPGTTLCTKPAGTGHNLPSHTPWSAFGNATNGNCFGQLRVKDY